MAQTPTCLVCRKEMEPGFLTDLSGNNLINTPRWCRGKPEATSWSGEVKNFQHREGVKVVAYRCPECEALRLYAPSNPAD
jgi:hypothetical protein